MTTTCGARGGLGAKRALKGGEVRAGGRRRGSASSEREFGLAGAVVRQRQQADHRPAGGTFGTASISASKARR